MTRRIKHSLLWHVIAVAAAATAAHAADEPSNTISVAGSATVKGRPTSVVISATIAGEAELAADASVKYSDAKKKVAAAVAAMNNPDLTMTSTGSSIEQAVDAAAQQRMMNGNGGAETVKPKVRISEQVKLTLAHADGADGEKLMAAVLKLIDTARDAGLQVGPPSPKNYYEMQQMSNNGQSGGGLAQFRIADVSDLQDRAYKAAMDDARRRAQRLADLAGVKLGRVVSAQDGGAGGESQTVYYNRGGETTTSVVTKDVTSGVLADIPVTVKLNVQFEIVPLPDARK